MKIKQTVERECCDERKGDLKPYRGKGFAVIKDRDAEPEYVDPESSYKPPMFCGHCGQMWVWDRRMDAAGGTESYLRRPGEKR